MANETKLQLPNGQWLILKTCDSRLVIGHLTTDGVDAWICSISNNGVNVYTNSDDSAEVMTHGLSPDDPIVLPSLNDKVIKERLMCLVENMTVSERN